MVEITDAVGVTTVSYRSDGTYDTVTLPNGVTASYTARPGAGDLATLTYANASGVLGVFERDYDIRGRVIVDTSPDGSRAYTYDGLGRLVTVVDKDPGGVLVETREYGFDANTNRITFTVTPATGSPTTVSYSYDSADRLTEVTGGPNPGLFSYDGNGNTMSMPGVTLSWTGDNRIASIATSSVTVVYGYDALGRTLSRSDGTTTSLYHYGGDGDAPAWVQDGTTPTRYVPGPAGLSAAQVIGGDVTWLLTNPHGALWAHADSAGEITATFAFDEYGVPQGPATGDLGLDRYGWLGQQQRETDPGSGLILMGVRVYDPTLGRFLTIDPIHGGSANDYEYTAGDPINNYDLDGKCVFGRNPDGSCRGGRVVRAAGHGFRQAGRAIVATASRTVSSIKSAVRGLDSRLQRACRYHPATGALLILATELVAGPLHLAGPAAMAGGAAAAAGIASFVAVGAAVAVGLYMMVRC